MAKRVFITGSSRGIGMAIAARYAKEGFDIIAPTRGDLDLASPDSIRSYLKRHVLDVDVLVNNAGENKINPIDATSLEDWQRILTTNLTSAFLLTQAAASKMQSRKWGRIVNMSSCYSMLSRPGRAAYSASKSGLDGFTRTAALEYGQSNVLVNAVCPGFVETEMTRQNNSDEQIHDLCAQTALNRLGSPDEIADFVFYLGSDHNTYITGQTLLIDGGFSCQ